MKLENYWAVVYYKFYRLNKIVLTEYKLINKYIFLFTVSQLFSTYSVLSQAESPVNLPIYQRRYSFLNFKL